MGAALSYKFLVEMKIDLTFLNQNLSASVEILSVYYFCPVFTFIDIYPREKIIITTIKKNQANKSTIYAQQTSS